MSDARSLREACAALRAPDLRERFSPIGREPLLVVAIEGDAPDDPNAARELLTIPVPSVALVRAPDSAAARAWAARFDAIAADERELAAIVAAVRRAPLAAATLVRLLRDGASRSIEEGLWVESLAYSTLLAGPEFGAWLAARDTSPGRGPVSAAPLALARAGARLRITLTRPERRNAYSVALRDALVEALELALHDDSITHVVLDAEGPAFCAGGDLDEFGTTPDPVTAHAVRTTRSAARLFAALAQRIEVRVQGACVGAGIELGAFAGRVVARNDAWFALPELAMGLIPGAGGTVSLPRRIGRQRTAWLALTGARLDAATAVAWGLADAPASLE